MSVRQYQAARNDDPRACASREVEHDREAGLIRIRTCISESVPVGRCLCEGGPESEHKEKGCRRSKRLHVALSGLRADRRAIAKPRPIVILNLRYAPETIFAACFPFDRLVVAIDEMKAALERLNACRLAGAVYVLFALGLAVLGFETGTINAASAGDPRGLFHRADIGGQNGRHSALAEGDRRNGSLGGSQEPIRYAAVIGADDRKPMSKFSGLSPTERERVLQCMGQLTCKARTAQYSASASLVCPQRTPDTPPCAADRILTAGHTFIDDKANRYISDLKRCEFRTFTGHRAKIVTSDAQVYDPEERQLNPRKNSRIDPIGIRLQRPIQDCKPYELSGMGISVRAGTELIIVTAGQADFDPNEPIVAECKATKSFEPKGGRPGGFYSDCDVNAGGSGGLVFRRREGEKDQTVAGVLVAGGSHEHNGKEYDESPDIKNYTVVIETNGDFNDRILRPGRPFTLSGRN